MNHDSYQFRVVVITCSSLTILLYIIYIYQPLTIKVSKIINHSPLTIIMISTISPTKDVAGTVVTSVVEQQHKVLRSGPTRLKDLATPRQMGRSPDHGEMIYGINIIRKHNNMCIFLTIYIYTMCIYIYSYIQLLVVILSIRLVSANLFGGLCWPDELAGSTVTHTVNLVNSTQANLQTMRPHVIICYNVINILLYIRNH